MNAGTTTLISLIDGVRLREENARLKHEHDELVAALEDCIEQLRQCGQGSCRIHIDLAEAVLAKVKGA